MIILGLNAFHGDSSAATVDVQLTGAIEEERLNRKKHWAGLPVASALAVLNGAQPNHIAISRDPKAHFLRKLARLATRPSEWARLSARANNSVRVAHFNNELRSAGIGVERTEVHYVEHHRAHLASAFFCSPFEEAAVVSIDGFGDCCSLMWGIGRGNKIEVKSVVLFPHSLGLFYTAFTQFLGFPNYGDEYKMMGLSAYGEPRFVQQVRDIVCTKEDQIRLNLDYFTHHRKGVEMTWSDCTPNVGSVYSHRMVESFGEPRLHCGEIEGHHADLAASVQAVLEESYFSLLNHIQRKTGQKAVCLAGGVALNCVANGKILERSTFRDVYIQPASHDAGTAIGAALHVQHQVLDHPRCFVMRHVYYGPEHTDSEIQRDLDAGRCNYHKLSHSELLKQTAVQIANGSIVGWYQGRAEFGPRALGNRSILADPRRAEMKDILNSRIKYREHFRPFCPSILAESVGDFFETDYPSPFMVMAYRVKPKMRIVIPAVTHKDGTGRLQTVEKDVNPLYWQLIRRFCDITGVPVLLNTSFNENEPIVNNPEQALDCFLRTQMDVLVIGSYLLLKNENVSQSEKRIALSAISGD